jgi:hypothetical protein
VQGASSFRHILGGRSQCSGGVRHGPRRARYGLYQ